MNAVKSLDVMIEQPCNSYQECLSVRKNGPPLPMILDENIEHLGVGVVSVCCILKKCRR